jgi:DNA-binding transcriptional MerR regulator
MPNMEAKKTYNKVELAKELNVHYQTINYWIKKGWIKPMRDYRNYPVFTEDDVQRIIKWKNTLK